MAHILVIDADDAIGPKLTPAFAHGKHSLLIASTVAEAGVLASSNEIDVVLESAAPGLEGVLAGAEEVLRRQPGAQLVVVAGPKGTWAGQRALALGAFDYLPHSAGVDDLLHAVTRALEEKHRQTTPQRPNSEYIEKLRKSEQRFRALVEEINDVIFELSTDGRLIYVSPAVQSTFGYCPAALVGRHYRELIHPEDVPGLARGFLNAMDGRGFPQEYRVRRKNGSYCWVRSSSRAIEDDDGSIVGIRGMLTDVSELKRVEVELRSSRRLLTRIFASLSDAILVVDKGTRNIISCNPAVKRIFGYSPEEIIGRNSRFLYPDQGGYRELGRDYYDALIHNNIVRRRYPLRRKNGTLFTAEITLTEFRDEAGIRTGVVCVIRDITAQAKAETALRERGEWFRAVFHGSRDAVLISSPDGGLVDVNQAAVQLTGYKRRQLLDMSFADLQNRQQPAHHTAQAAQQPSREAEICEAEIVRKDGSRVFVEFSSRAIEIAGIPLIHTTVRDISERKEAARNLRSLSERLSSLQETERGRLAQEMHDRLGQTLTALSINLTAEKEARADRTGETEFPLIDECLRLTDMLGEATEDLMVDLHPPALDEYGLVPALRWYGDRVRRLLQARIQVEAAGDPLRLDHDTELGIFRIVQEALTNVTKHAEATDVRISIQQDRQETFVTVDDNGKGFDTDQVAGSDGKRRWGLAIMKERARAFGGTLHVESKPGCGTRVMLRLETSPA